MSKLRPEGLHARSLGRARLAAGSSGVAAAIGGVW